MGRGAAKGRGHSTRPSRLSVLGDGLRDPAAGGADAGEVADELPWRGFLYEPKWDGFRAIVFCGATDVYIQSRDLRPLDRTFRSCSHATACEGSSWTARS
jgi:hypothetical protein